MSVDKISPKESLPSKTDDGALELPVKLVPYEGQVPEPLAGFFQRLSPWDWRDLRTVFCRFPEVRRLVNIVRTIDLVFEKAPHTLARGHWSIAEFLEAREKLSSAIVRLGHLANQVAADSRIRLPVVPARAEAPPPPPRTGFRAPLTRAPGAFQRVQGGVKSNFASRRQAA